MTHYYRHYDDPSKTREQHDEQAVRDLEEYLSPRQLSTIRDCLAQPLSYSVQDLNILLGFCGVSGRPFFALMRKHRLEDFKAWCRSDQGGKPREVDEAGFFVDGE